MNMPLEIQARLQIAKPIHEVFEAIVDPQKMSNYFIEKGSGRMEAGTELMWKFPEFSLQIPIRVNKIENDKYVSYYWEGVEGKQLLVEINLTSPAADKTLVTVTEKSMENDEQGLRWLKSNTEGWANFLACMKAYLEYGINLRKGGFDFMKSGD